MRLLLAILITSLTGCGFHLRGAEPLEPGMERVYLDIAESSPLRYELETLLLAAGSEVVEQRAAATSLLVVHSATIRSRTLSLDIQGRASEYGLTLSVKYQLQSEGDASTGKPLSSRVERDLRVNPDNILVQGAEREKVEQEMYRVAARQMVRRLRRIAKVPAPSDSVLPVEAVPAQ